MQNQVIEILQYRLKPQSGQTFHQIMCEISVPLHKQHGIDVIAYGNSLHDIDSYYLIRAFETETKLQQQLDAFYASDDWRDGPRESIIRLIESSLKSVIMLPTQAIHALHNHYPQ
ncbi:TPA: NIPSNAP family protein [Pasteurella multocida]|nr:NIPSNAP family protein [Pasteurella multocida]